MSFIFVTFNVFCLWWLVRQSWVGFLCFDLVLFSSQYVLCSFFVSHVEKFCIAFYESFLSYYLSKWLKFNWQFPSCSILWKMLIMKLAFSSHLLFMLLDFGTLLLFTYHFHIIFYTLSLKLSLLAVNGSFLKSKQFVGNGCLMARKIGWKKVLFSWSSQRP